MALGLNIERLVGNFGAEIRNIDVPGILDADLKGLLMGLYEHRFLVLRTGGLTNEEYVTFARRVGDPIYLSANKKIHPEIAAMSNIDTDSVATKKGAAHWHSDQSFKKEVSSITMLYSVQAPDRGGETLFCDMVAAYEALSNTIKTQIEKLIVEHRHGVSVVARPGDHTPIPPKNWDQSTTVCHPLVRRHPVTDRKTLYAVSGTSQAIRGMAQEDGKRLLQELCDHTFQDQFINQHRHSVHDLVMWDNPTTLHSATPISAASGPHDTRVIHRISLRGTPSVFAP